MSRVVNLPAVTAQQEMTLRDYFAAAALQGMMADKETRDRRWHEFAEKSYSVADAMLVERAK